VFSGGQNRVEYQLKVKWLSSVASKSS